MEQVKLIRVVIGISIFLILSACHSILISTIFIINPYLSDFFSNSWPIMRKRWNLLIATARFAMKGQNLPDKIKKIPTSELDEYKSDVIKLDVYNTIKPELQYALNHAISIYPPFILASLRMTCDTKDTASSTMGLVKQIFGLKGEDWILHCDPILTQDFTFLNILLYFRGRNNVYEPQFYLIRDDRQHKHVLTIRGSTSLTDWMTDFSAESVDFTVQGVKGKAHKGMLKSAEYIYYFIINKIREIYQNKIYKHYPLIITGHSLGAGVASLLGFMFIRTEDEQRLNEQILKHMKVYSFATPSIVSANIADIDIQLAMRRDSEDVKQNYDHYNNGYKNDVKEMDENQPSLSKDKEENVKNKLITSVILNTDIVSRIGIEPLKKMMGKTEKKGHRNKDIPLYPAGKILWFMPKRRKGRGESLRAVLSSIFCLYRYLLKKGINSDGSPQDPKEMGNFLNAVDSLITNTDSVIFNTVVSDFRDIMNEIRDGKDVKYGENNWQLCDASQKRLGFGDLIYDGYESFYAHFPYRYAWALGLERRFKIASVS